MGKMLSDMQLSDLCLKMASLLHAGVDPGQAANLLKVSGAEGVINCIKKGGEEGLALHESLASSGRVPLYVVGLLEAALDSGRSEEALLALSGYYEGLHGKKRQLRQALGYPAVLLALMSVVIYILLAKVMPVFESVYASMGAGMDGLAGGLLSAGRWLDWALPWICLFFGLHAAAAMIVYLVPAARRRFVSDWLRLFGTRGATAASCMAKVAQAVSLAVSAGRTLEESFAVAGKLVADVPGFGERCEDAARRLASSGSVYNALLESKVLPDDCCTLVALGQRAGTLEQACSHVSARLSREADEALDALMGKIEPAIVVSMSLVVGLVMMAAMLPLLDIMSVLM